MLPALRLAAGRRGSSSSAAAVAALLPPLGPPPASPHTQHQQHQHQQHQQQRRRYVDGKIGADADEVAELLESSIVRPSRAEREAAAASGRGRLLTTRREALSLYREVLRYSNLFVWKDEHGRMWRDVIRASARQEFEAARRERDPELINRMIVTGRDAVQRTVDGFIKRRARIIAEEEADPGRPRM